MQLFRLIHASEAVKWEGKLEAITEFLQGYPHIKVIVPPDLTHITLKISNNRLVVHRNQWIVRNFTPFDDYTVMTDREFKNAYSAVTHLFPQKSTLQEAK